MKRTVLFVRTKIIAKMPPTLFAFANKTYQNNYYFQSNQQWKLANANNRAATREKMQFPRNASVKTTGTCPVFDFVQIYMYKGAPRGKSRVRTKSGETEFSTRRNGWISSTMLKANIFRAETTATTTLQITEKNHSWKKATERECVCTCEVVAISAKHRGKARNVPAKSHAKSAFPAFCTRITILFLAAFELGTMWPKY